MSRLYPYLYLNVDLTNSDWLIYIKNTKNTKKSKKGNINVSGLRDFPNHYERCIVSHMLELQGHPPLSDV